MKATTVVLLPCNLQSVVEPGQGLDEHIDTFVAILVATCSEVIQSILKIEIEMPVEMSADEFVDLFFLYRM